MKKGSAFDREFLLERYCSIASTGHSNLSGYSRNVSGFCLNLGLECFNRE